MRGLNRQATPEETIEGIKFSLNGRMQYHPEFHFAHEEPFTLSELVYMCKYVQIDGNKSMSMALGRTENTIANQVYMMKKEGFFDVLKSLSDEEWERIIEREERKSFQGGAGPASVRGG